MHDILPIRKRLEALADNLWWTWQREIVAVFRDLNPTLWREVNHNPIAFLKRMDDEELHLRARTRAIEDRILAASRRLDAYLEDRDTWGASYAGLLTSFPVAYFSAEFGLHESLPLYSGGLGVLAGDHLKSASDLGVPLVGVGLFYAHGYFSQHLDKTGWQQETYGENDAAELPLGRILGPDGSPALLEIPCGQEIVKAQVWKTRIGRCRLLLLDTDIQENTSENRGLTHRLYWGDQTNRMKQELILGVGGQRALALAGIRPSVFHLNEGHSAFALLEGIRMEMEENGTSFDEAVHRVGSKSVFTTHTPVPAGHDRFSRDMVLNHLGWMLEPLHLSEQDFLALGRVDPKNDGEQFCMTVLALKLAHKSNGVANVHGDVSRQMWKDLWPDLPTHAVPIGHITNGVHTRSWMAPQFSTQMERLLGHNWFKRTSRQELWADLKDVPPLELWETHQILKAELLAFVRSRFVDQEMRRGQPEDAAGAFARGLLDQNTLTLGFARRFATYKRATLLFRDKERLLNLMNDPHRPVQMVFAGKSHPKDDGGKSLIQEIANLQTTPGFAGRIAFLEDYDINVGRHLVQGVDVWVNNPLRPEEACGTSGMKGVLNGVLNLSIRDGWWAEAYDGRNGFDIASPGPHRDPEIQNERDHEALMKALEEEVIPLFYERDRHGLPQGWIDRMKWAFVTLAWRFSADRMVKDYVLTSYLPAAQGDSSRA